MSAPANIAADLALLEIPDKPKPRTLITQTDRMKIRIFLRDLDLAPGRTRGPEICSLYRYFKYWLRWVDKKAHLPHHKHFAEHINALGLRKRLRCRNARGVNCSFICMRKDSAERVREWLARHPDTPEERALFHLGR